MLETIGIVSMLIVGILSTSVGCIAIIVSRENAELKLELKRHKEALTFVSQYSEMARQQFISMAEQMKKQINQITFSKN